MAVRTQEQLRREQARLLEEYRTDQPSAGAAQGAAEMVAPGWRIGRITAVVSSDPTHGPHLVIKPQVFSDRPPVPSDSAIPTQIAYPTPTRTVGDYQVDEYVALWITKGAAWAVKL